MKRVLALCLGALVLSGPAGAAVPQPPIADVVAFVHRLDAALDRLPRQPYPADRRVLGAWTAELLPLYVREGVAAKNLPVRVRFERYSGENFEWLLGSTTSFREPEPMLVTLNARFANRASAWYGSPEFLWTLAHELAHSQGVFGYCYFGCPLIESSAQVVTAEVLAAEVDAGDGRALPALLSGLREMALGTLEARDRAEYELALADTLADEPFELAAWHRLDRQVAGDWAGRAFALQQYAAAPLALLLDGLPRGWISGRELLLPINGDWRKLPQPGHRRLRLDDLGYVLRPGVLEAMVS